MRRYPPQPVSVLGPTTTVTLLPIGLGYFLSQTFSHINTPTFLKPSHPSYLSIYEDRIDRVFQNIVGNSQTQSSLIPIRPLKMERTECSETSLRILKPSHSLYLSAYEDGTDGVFWNVVENFQTQLFFIPIRLWRWNRVFRSVAENFQVRWFFKLIRLLSWNRVFRSVVDNSQTESFFTSIRLWRWNRQSVLKRRWEFSNLVILHTYPLMKMEQSVPKRRWEFSNPVILHTYSPMKMEQTECSETSLRILKPSHSSNLSAYEDGTDRVFRNVVENSQT